MGSPDFAPRAVGGTVDVDLTGKVFPWANGQPVLLAMPMSEWLYLPVFSTPGELADVMGQASVPYMSVKRIDNQAEFLLTSTVPGNVKVITNVRFTDKGTVRFSQVEWVSHE